MNRQQKRYLLILILILIPIHTHRKERSDGAGGETVPHVSLPGNTTARDLLVQMTWTSVQRWILRDRYKSQYENYIRENNVHQLAY